VCNTSNSDAMYFAASKKRVIEISAKISIFIEQFILYSNNTVMFNEHLKNV